MEKMCKMQKQVLVRFICLLVLMPVCLNTRAQSTFDYFYLEAEKCRLAEDYPSALELYGHCLELHPESAATIYNLALIHFYLQNDSLGTEMLQRACRLDSRNPWYLESLASVYLNKRNTEESIPVLEKLASLQSRRSDVLSQLVRIYKTKGETDMAIRTLNRIELIEGKTAQISMEKFLLYMDREDRASAFRELQALCDEFPHDMNYRVLLGNQYLQFDEKEKGLALYEEVRQKEPSNINLHLAMIAYYNGIGDKERFKSLRDSLLLDSGTLPELRVDLMKMYVDDALRDSLLAPELIATFDTLLARPQKDVQMLLLWAAYQLATHVGEDQLAETMRRILEVEPGHQLALSQLLQYYAKKEDAQGMEDICRRGVNYYPEELSYAYFLGLTLYQQQKSQEAVAIFEQGLRSREDNASPQLVSDLFSVLGDIHYQANRPEEAFAAYDSSLVYVENNLSCLNNYAYYLCLREEHLDKAEEMSYRTIKAEPTNPTYLDTYAWILFVKKDYAGARMYMDKVVPPHLSEEELLARADLSGNVIEHAGDVYAQCGEMETAFRYWKTAARKADGTCTPSLNKKLKKKKYIK